MRHLAAYLLACLGEGGVPNAATIRSILGSVGIEADDANLDVLVKKFSGKNIDAIIAEGRAMMSSIPSSAGVAVAAGGGGDAAPAKESSAQGGAPAKEEKKEEPEEESDDDMGFGLFD